MPQKLPWNELRIREPDSRTKCKCAPRLVDDRNDIRWSSHHVSHKWDDLARDGTKEMTY